MDSTSPKLYLEREHRFSVGDLDNLVVTVQRSDEDGGEECSAQMLDFSRKGVKLLLPISVRFEETVKLDFEFKNTDLAPYSGLAQIRHIRDDGENGWQVGCSVQPSIGDEVIAHLASSSGKERRRHQRYNVSGQGTLQRQGETETTTVQIKNISEGGFCLAVPDQHTVGERVKLEMRDWEDQVQTIDAEIRWQVSTLVGYFVGCSFADAEGFRKLASCVLEGRPKTFSISRFMMIASIITMLIPSIAYLWTNSSSPVANAEMFASSKLETLDPEPTFVPEVFKRNSAKTQKKNSNFKRPKFNRPSRTTAAKPSRKQADTPDNGQAVKLESPEKTPVVDLKNNRDQPNSATDLVSITNEGVLKPSTVEKPDSVPNKLTTAQETGLKAVTTTLPAPKVKKPESGNELSETEGEQPIDPELKALMALKAQGKLRMWTDDSGLYRIEAALLKIEGEMVVLRGFDDSIKKVPLKRLCDEDREYLSDWEKQKKEADSGLAN